MYIPVSVPNSLEVCKVLIKVQIPESYQRSIDSGFLEVQPIKDC
jgi:hypothetical protein